MRPQAANIDVVGMIKGIKAAVRSYRIVSYRIVSYRIAVLVLLEDFIYVLIDNNNNNNNTK
jgi:hypothetical protein